MKTEEWGSWNRKLSDEDELSVINSYKNDIAVAEDKIVVMREDGEYHVPLSQLNRTVYHIEKRFAELEIEEMLKLHLIASK